MGTGPSGSICSSLYLGGKQGPAKGDSPRAHRAPGAVGGAARGPTPTPPQGSGVGGSRVHGQQ